MITLLSDERSRRRAEEMGLSLYEYSVWRDRLREDYRLRFGRERINVTALSSGVVHP